MSDNTKTPAVEGTTTGRHESFCHREKEYPCHNDYSTMPARCQEVTIPRWEYDMLMDKQFRYDMLRLIAQKSKFVTDIESLIFGLEKSDEKV
jgi:hypothetical protein